LPNARHKQWAGKTLKVIKGLKIELPHTLQKPHDITHLTSWRCWALYVL
jgi:hypothetical protein